MLKTPEDDPGGGSQDPPQDGTNKQQIAEREEQEDSQVLLAQLKEVLRKNEIPPLTPEKFELYANTLSRAKRKQKKSHEGKKAGTSQRVVETSANEKLNLLRQQLEENKAKLAERGKNQKGIEEMVSQLKAQLDDSQHLINQTPLNLSLVEHKTDYSKNSSSEELYNILINKEKYITELNVKVQRLEANNLDLQENLKEKDSVIDARTKAITLMTESLTKKGKTTLDTLDETKEQMRKMQEDFINMEENMKARQVKLLDDLKHKNLEIVELQSSIHSLQGDKNDLEEQLKNKDLVLEQLQSEREEVDKYSTKIAELQARIKELEESESSLSQETESPRSEKKGKKNKGRKFKSSNETAKVFELEQSLSGEKLKNEELLKKIAELEETVVKLHENMASQTVAGEDQEGELSKLKKQLDESNKNMIRVKAQHKSKIKELNKKIEDFKKISDVNAEIFKLQAENSSLGQKIAELEEEKGNLQLKLIEADSLKDSTVKESEEAVPAESDALQGKDEIIKQLEQEIKSSNDEIESLTEKLNSLLHVQNVQVTTEMASIRYEELIDKVESEKKTVLEEKANLAKENEELLAKIETLKKEKQDLNQKLENYVQENMELIDKLEKLSTEKVSSAESIEIVEGLTQQEKLEIEQFQKNLDIVSGHLKASEENLLQNPDLNDSVNLLKEETSELLQKIELFTVERREVMDKMETLTNENNTLNLRIKEIENNRDVLVETYEQLQNEKESMEHKIGVLETENSQLLEKLENASMLPEPEPDNIKEKMRDKENQLDVLLKENELLQVKIKELSELASEKDNLDSQLRELRNNNNLMEETIQNYKEEIVNYQSIIEDNRNELISSAQVINNLQEKLQNYDSELKGRQNEIERLNSIISDMNDTIMKRDRDDQNNSEDLKNELENLKSALNEHINKAQEYEEELNENSDIIANLHKELKSLNNKILETEHLLDSKDDEIKKLSKDRDNKETVISNLQETLQEKDKVFLKLKDEFKEKFLNMQKQMETNSDTLQDLQKPLQKTVDELSNKNREQLEKMKKIAANLKKKTQLLSELEKKYQEDSEKWEAERREKDQLVSDYETKYSSLSAEYQSIQEKNVELQNVILDLRSKEKSTEVNLKQELLSASSFEPDHQNNNETLNSRIRELEMIVESRENSISSYKNRIDQLEEQVAMVEESRKDYQNQICELNQKLNEKCDRFEEMAQIERVLSEKLTGLNEQKESLEKTLQESNNEIQKLTEHSKKLTEQNKKLKHKILIAHEKVGELTQYENLVADLRRDNSDLSTQIAGLENEIKHLQGELQHATAENKKELEKLDNDWQQQYNNLIAEKSDLSVQVEKLNEDFNALLNKDAALTDEVNECKLKLEENYTEYDRLMNENQTNIQTIGKLSSQLLELQDIKVMYESLNSESEHYKQQISQLQNEKIALQNELSHLSHNQVNQMANATNELNIQLERTLSEKFLISNRLEEIQNNYLIASEELNKTNVQLQEARKQIEDLERELGNLKLASITQTAFHTVDSVVDTAEKKVTETQSQTGHIPTFTWPQETRSLEQDETAMKHNIEGTNSQEKIKMLEFLLYNEEKSRKEILNQCHILSLELSRLLLEKKSEKNEELENVDAAIFDTVKVLQTGIVSDQSEPFNREPVTEEPCIAETAYLCYKEGGETIVTLQRDIKKLELMLQESERARNEIAHHCQILSEELLSLISERESNLAAFPSLRGTNIEIQTEAIGNDSKTTHTQTVESQILSEQDVKDTPSTRRELQELQFVRTREIQPEATYPVIEDRVQCESAYLCTKNETTQPISVDIFGDNDDGWGLNSEETRFEEEHRQQSSSSALLEELQDRIRVLELERNNHLEEIRQLQVKSGKLIKKVKELRQVNEKLSAAKKPEPDFFNLDEEIQEQLKLQVGQLEKKLKELNFDLNKERNEKAALTKRVDVLTAANERMTDMKEKQDIEVLNLQRKIEDLKEKFKNSVIPTPEETAQQESEHEKPSESDIKALRLQVEELNEVIKDLTLDNEELQSHLEEQRRLRLDAEKSKEPIVENMKTEKEYSDLLTEKNRIDENLKSSLEEKKHLQNELNMFIKKSNEQEVIFAEIKANNDKLNELLSEKNYLVEDLIKRVQSFEEEKAKTKQLEAQDVSNLQSNLDIIIQEKQEIEKKYEDLQKETTALLSEKSKIEEERNAISNELQVMTNLVMERDCFIENQEREFSLIQREIEVLKQLELEAGSQDNTEYEEQIKNISFEKDNLIKRLEEKEQQLDDVTKSLDLKISELNREMERTAALLEQNKTLEQSLSRKNAEFEELSQQNSTQTSEISLMIEQLNQEWESRVNQRGTDVAESWKLHLENRESEFSSLEESLRKEILLLEEKCNALMNENNELRKNVDAEIRNEIDRITTLQDQIKDNQSTINNLIASLEEKQAHIEKLQNEIVNYETQLNLLNQLMQEKETTIAQHVSNEESIRKELTENEELIQSIIKKLQENDQSASCLKTDLLNELNKQLSLIEARNEEISSLKSLLNNYIPKDEIIQLNSEIVNANTALEELKNKLSTSEAIIAEKNQENSLLSEKLANLENHVSSDSEITNRLQNDLAQYQQQYDALKSYLSEKETEGYNLKTEIKNYQMHLKNKDQELMSLKNLLTEKEQQLAYAMEEASLSRNSIHAEYTQEMNNLRCALTEAETRFENTISEKENDLLYHKTYCSDLLEKLNGNLNEFHQKNEEIERLSGEVNQKDATIKELEQKIVEQNLLLNEEDKQLADLRAIIEDQVLKIEQMKKELFEKSNDYDSLIAEMDIQRHSPNESRSVEQNVSVQSTAAVAAPTEIEDDMSEPVCRAELDLTLYMLHQRDVRCEELTVELTQLLEERDTLQLRLSNALREKEELRRKYCSDSGPPGPHDESSSEYGSPPRGAVPKSRASEILLGASGTELATEAVETLQRSSESNLASKLSELKTVSHKKDKTLVDEQEVRRFQQLNVMQQHRDAASKLPAEAAARLIDAGYTLSRDVQSPSKVLLNWLWGKSTPRVNDI